MRQYEMAFKPIQLEKLQTIQYHIDEICPVLACFDYKLIHNSNAINNNEVFQFITFEKVELDLMLHIKNLFGFDDLRYRQVGKTLETKGPYTLTKYRLLPNSRPFKNQKEQSIIITELWDTHHLFSNIKIIPIYWCDQIIELKYV